MSAPRRQSKRPLDVHDVWSGLAQPASAPDLSGAIMQRLGYTHLSPKQARRRTLAARANRAAILMLAAIAFGVGWRVFEASPQIRRPAETTISEAIHHDVQLQQQRLERAIRSIRAISTPQLQIDAEGGESENQGWEERQRHREFEDDVNRSTIAPVRWV